MEGNPICPVCHVAVRATDYFCFNCGKNLHPKPLSTSIGKQFLIYIGSILLPPMGIIWGMRYLRQKGGASKGVGLTAIVITIIVLVMLMKYTTEAISLANKEVERQLNMYQGF